MQKNETVKENNSIISGGEKQIMKNIESKSMAKAELAYTTGRIFTSSNEQNMSFAHNIIASGSDEFVKKVGRQPTYSELREMFG